MGDAERCHGIAEWSGLTGGEDDADLWEGKAEGADEAKEGGVREVAIWIGLVLVVSGVGPHAGKCDGELGFPAVLVEILQVSGEGESFVFPVGKTEEGADTYAAEASCVGALWATEAPVEFLFWSCGVEGFVGFAVIGFLVDDEAFGSVVYDVRVLVVFHGADFQCKGGEEGDEGVEAVLKVAFGDELRVLSGD